MKPGTYDFTLQRSGSQALRIRLRDANGPMAISSSELRVWWRDGGLTKRMGDGLEVIDNTVAWTPSPNERASVPRGKIARYSWAVNGETYLEGRIEGTGGG